MSTFASVASYFFYLLGTTADHPEDAELITAIRIQAVRTEFRMKLCQSIDTITISATTPGELHPVVNHLTFEEARQLERLEFVINELGKKALDLYSARENSGARDAIYDSGE